MFKLSLTPSVIAALFAAILFGSSTPFAKQLIGGISPLLLAGLLYLGSGIGLILFRLIKNGRDISFSLGNKEWLWLGGAILFGGVLAPVLLMTGLQATSAANASLLLNFEAVLTAILAWIFFKEHTHFRIVMGMVAIVAGGFVLAWSNQLTHAKGFAAMLIVGACLCWAIDNNLTRKVSGADALFIAGSKGLVAGVVNVSLALMLGQTFPTMPKLSFALLVGLLGYGVSLVLFIYALRGLGTARTSAYFSTAPFIGAVIAIVFMHEPVTSLFWLAAVLMGIGVWLHLTERHEHLHTHEALLHDHYHVHDEHHQHEHDFPWDNKKPHAHPHQHAPITHSHPHYPDIHHQHTHKK